MTIELPNDKDKIAATSIASQEFAIDGLLAQFHDSVSLVSKDPKKHANMVEALRAYNPKFTPVLVETDLAEAKVLANVVGGIYAPLIHGFTTTIIRNIKDNRLPNVIVAPPRDAIPLAIALQAHSEIQGVDIKLLMPHVNRNTAGIVNNQKDSLVGRSPHLDLLLDQIVQSMGASIGAVEIEPGIYGTTSLIMAEAFKARKLDQYFPIKFYGLGPTSSYVHAVLSGGNQWVAERAEGQGLVETSQINDLMVLLDTMEELGMEKAYKCVEHLELGRDGAVEPVLVPSSAEESEIARVTNGVIKETASQYANITASEVRALLNNVPFLVEHSQEGLPFTLAEPIPSMDSKEKHFDNIRKSKLFDYPNLSL